MDFTNLNIHISHHDDSIVISCYGIEQGNSVEYFQGRYMSFNMILVSVLESMCFFLLFLAKMCAINIIIRTGIVTCLGSTWKNDDAKYVMDTWDDFF